MYLSDNDFKHGTLLSKRKSIPLKPIENFIKLDMSAAKYKEEADGSQPNDTPSRLKIWEDNIKIYDKNQNFTSKKIPTITTKQDRNPNSGVIYYSNIGKEGKAQFRYLTPRECFLLMGFDEEDFDRLINHNFNVNKNRRFFTQAKLIKMAGNSIVVDVLVEVFKQIDELNQLIINENESTRKCV